MKITGFNFNKIKVERLSDRIEEVKIKTNINISEIKEIEKESLKPKESLLNIKFNYTLNYNPEIAKIELGGNAIIILNEEKSKEILEQWENKNLPDELKVPLFNFILKKANIKAIQLEDEINLPIHIQLPRLQPKKE